MLLGQGRQRLGVVQHEGGLDEVRLDHGLEDLVLQSPAGKQLYRLGLATGPEQHRAHRSFAGGAEIQPAALLHRLDELESREWAGKVQHRPEPVEHQGAGAVLDHA